MESSTVTGPPKEHNNPPSMAETVTQVTYDLNEFLKEHPIIETEEQARQAKEWNDRAYLCIQDLEDERSEKVRPLNEQVKKINSHYKGPRELLEGVVNELKSRLDQFILAEEAKRIAAAEEARKRAEQAEQVAREAERAEIEALESARTGVLGLDIADATANANQAFAEHQKAQRQAQVAEREIPVRIGGGIRPRVLSARNTEVLHVSDPVAVILAVGLTEDIKKVLKAAARAYKRLHGEYPKGITVTLERGT